jgi:tRNA(Ile)-lysidine synthase
MRKSNSLNEQILKTIRNYDMLKPGDKVLVAVSGGPDSVFLLHSLNFLKSKLKLGGIFIANLDHGIRGKESREDSLFVKRLAAELGLRFVHKKVSLRGPEGRSNLSTEELAREARYKFFDEACEKTEANVIATGHTLDDQAETILMRLIKGSSLKGMVGVMPVRGGESIKVIRPIIELEKKEIAEYLDGAGIDYRIDHTNAEPIYFRNIVRAQIIPFLEKYNPRLKRVLFNLAEHLREDFEFIEEHKVKARKIIASGDKGEVVLKLKDIVVQPKVLQKELLRDCLEKTGGEVKRLSFRHWKEMESFIKYKRKGDSLDLPGAIRVTRTSDEIIFYKI